MRFDSVIIGGGLAGLTAGISLQEEGRSTAIVSTGQNALHFFSGCFESLQEPPQRMQDLFAGAGVRLHYREGVRLMPLGTFRPAALALADIDLVPVPHFADKVLIVGFAGFQDFFPAFLADGLAREGMQCRTVQLELPELERLRLSPSEMRSVQIARTLDRIWGKVIREVKHLLREEDAVVLPQVFGLQDPSVPEYIRQGLPVRVVFTGTLPPSVPGIRTQLLLKRRYEALGGTYLAGDEVVTAHIHGDVVHGIATRNLDSHCLEAGHFLLASGSYFSKGLKSTPFDIAEPVFGLDVVHADDRNAWYDTDFFADQPYMQFGVKTDTALHPLRDGQPLTNLYAIGSVLGATRPEFGFGAGLAVRSAFAAVDQILESL
ncbi:MAG: anaerobic glycerol-3-phosphate dehydrogenase subunit B [Bacteroidales bacterium]|nr:anaerobic glycerol-3-phosphate dehydrogenase subunit B [Bacteroidales bacterium]